MLVLERYSFQPRWSFKRLLPLIMIICLLMSCGGDDNGDGSPADDEVQKSLDRATSALEGINVPVSFKSVGGLGNVGSFADPLELGSLEDAAAIESAIGALNDALDAGGFSRGAIAAAPANGSDDEEHQELEVIIHLNLSYLYMLAAVSRCMIGGGDVYTIEANPDTPETGLYSLELKEAGQSGLAEVQAKDDPTAADFLNIFEAEQRLAILNALNLLDQVEASVEAIPDGGIDAQQPDYDRSICLYSSLYHHVHASQAAPLVGEQEVEVTDQMGIIVSQFSKSVEEKARTWQFTIQDRP